MRRHSDEEPKPARLQDVLKMLYKKHRKAKADIVKITLGELGEDAIDERIEALNFLKEKKVVLRYKTENGKEASTTDDEDDISETLDFELVGAICKISPKLLSETMRQLSLLPAFWVRIQEPHGHIILNDKYLMRTTRFGSENDNVFRYLYKHAGEQVMIETLEKKFGKLKKALRMIPRDLQFEGEIKKIFFGKVSVNAIQFRNNLFQKDIEQFGVNQKKLKHELNKLKTVSVRIGEK